MTDLFYSGQEIEVHNGERWTRGVVKTRTWLVLTVTTRGGEVCVERRHITRRVRLPKLALARAS